MRAVAIVPAYNEAPTVGDVVRTLVRSGVFSKVLVVSDGSTDGTEDIARSAGAQVLRLSPNRGKGGAMLAGLDATEEPVVAFFDADLVNFTPEHVAQLVDPVLRGRYGMVCGLRDYGPRWNAVQRSLPPITGERAVLRSILQRVPRDFWSGFRIEAGINEMARRSGMPSALTVLRGLNIRKKWEKVGINRGAQQMVDMARDILIAMDDASRISPAGQATARPPEVTVRPDGSVAGLDGLLAQVSGAVARSVRDELYPVLSRDTELQRRVGASAGVEVARALRVPAYLLAGAAIVFVATRSWRPECRCPK